MEDNHWAEGTIKELLLENVKEQRRSRRWNIFFKLLLLVYVLVVTFYFIQQQWLTTEFPHKQHSAVVDIVGPISGSEKANADKVNLALELAFKNKKSRGVIMRINTAGGSPVQARRIFDKVQMLKEKYPDMRVYAAIEDAGVSAGYLIACAADEIYADKTSLVGSIGVLISSFGVVEAMEDHGIERRLYKSGEHKGILDMFSPAESEEEEEIQKQLKYVHQQFIDNVKAGRGNRLKEHPKLYSGLFWPGGVAIRYGLIDGFGDVDYVARELIQAEDIVNYTQGSSFIDRFANRLGSSLAAGLHRMLGSESQIQF